MAVGLLTIQSPDSLDTLCPIVLFTSSVTLTRIFHGSRSYWLFTTIAHKPRVRHMHVCQNYSTHTWKLAERRVRRSIFSWRVFIAPCSPSFEDSNTFLLFLLKFMVNLWLSSSNIRSTRLRILQRLQNERTYVALRCPYHCVSHASNTKQISVIMTELRPQAQQYYLWIK